MLVYNLDRIFRSRSIDKPFSFMKKLGFADSHAHILSKGKTKSMKITTLERLCKALYCTPNDLMEWKSDKNELLSDDHPLHKLQHHGKSIDIISKLQTVPLDKLLEIEKYIENESKEKEQDSLSL